MANEANLLDAGVFGVEHLGGKYLTFKLAEEVYGLGILKVQEIIGIMAVTHVPKTPEFVRGVINLRGKVIPVVELRQKFDMHSVEDTEHTCVIVAQIERNGSRETMGLIVDEVSEVLDIRPDQIELPPAFGAGVDIGFILGLGKVHEKVVMLLDVDRTLSGNEIEQIYVAQSAIGE